MTEIRILGATDLDILRDAREDVFDGPLRLERAREFLSALTGGRDIKVPLTLDRGKVRLGPITVGDAPRLSAPY